MKPTLYYCYDAYCGWCYGFSPVMKKIAETYEGRLSFEVLSGGMIIDEQVQPIRRIADYIKTTYKRVEETTGIKFGEDFLWHINNPDESDWQMNSEKPAIALCVFKDYHPERQIEFATDLQWALNDEGRDLDDNEAYLHLLEKYSIHPEAFYTKLQNEEYRERAFYEFDLCRQLHVTGFPALLLQANESKFHLLTMGYMEFGELKLKIEKVLQEMDSAAVVL